MQRKTSIELTTKQAFLCTHQFQIHPIMSSHVHVEYQTQHLVGVILTIGLVLTTGSVGEGVDGLLESSLTAGAELLSRWLEIGWGLLEHGLLEEDGSVGGLGHVLLDET